MKKLLILISIFISISSIFIAAPDVNKQTFYAMEFEKQNNSQLPLAMQHNRLLDNEFNIDISKIIFEENVIFVGTIITIFSELLLIEQMNPTTSPALTGTAILAGGSMLGGILSGYQMSNTKDSLDVDEDDKGTLNVFGPSMILPVMISLIISGDPIMAATDNKVIGLGGMISLTVASLIIGDIIGSKLYRYQNR